MEIGRHIFVKILESIWDFAKEAREERRVSNMTPAELEEWRADEITKIHKQVLKLAGLNNDEELFRAGNERINVVRRAEVILRNEQGVKMSQDLLEGMDLRGLDLRKVKGLNQEQIDRTIGDGTTLLPNYLEIPQMWKRQK